MDPMAYGTFLTRLQHTPTELLQDHIRQENKVDEKTWEVLCPKKTKLVGGFNPSEKY